MLYRFFIKYSALLLFLTGCATEQVSRTEKVFFSHGEHIQISHIHKALNAPLNEADLLTFQKELQKQKGLINYWKEQLFLRGQFSYLEENFEKSRVYYKLLGALEPSNPWIQMRYGISLIRGGDLEAARKLLENSYKLKKDEKVGLLLAGIYMSLGEKKKARKAYGEILKINKKSDEACLLLSRIHIQDKNFKKGKAQLLKCSKQMPENVRFPYELGGVFFEEKNFSMAEKYFKKALGINERHSLSLLGLADVYREKKQDKKVLKTYHKYLEKYPEDYLVLNRAIAWYISHGKNEKALPLFERLLDLDSQNQNLKIRLGILYVECEKFEKAVGIFKEVLGENPKASQIHYYLGSIYLELEDSEQAIFHFSRVMEESPLFEDSILQISTLLSRRIERENGEREFLQFISQHEKRESISLELGVLKASFYEEKEDFKKAISALERLRGHKNFQHTYLLYLVSLYEKERDFKKVDGELKKILDEDPDNAQALNFLGYSYLERGIHREKSFAYISKALKIRPDDGYIRDSLGWYYYKVGEFKKALKLIQKAYKQSGEDNEIALHLVQVYQALGRDFEALALLRKTFEKVKSPKMREKIADSLKEAELDLGRRPASLKE